MKVINIDKEFDLANCLNGYCQNVMDYGQVPIQ